MLFLTLVAVVRQSDTCHSVSLVGSFGCWHVDRRRIMRETDELVSTVRKSCLIVAVLLLAQSCLAASTTFVHRRGRHFVVDRKSFYFGGDNLYYLGNNTTNTRVDSLTAKGREAGVAVIRMWAFNNGTPTSLQPAVHVYNETALRQLDYAVRKASDNGARVILTLVNNWNDFNGMQWYVDQLLGPGQSKDLFYTNTACRKAYEDYARMLVNRVNTYTGRKYKDDPAIFAWELANEPRCRSDKSGATLYNWIDHMAGYIKSIDHNHMVSTGEEGFKVGGVATDWTESGYDGVDFARNTANRNIDFATIHLYTDSWNKDNTWAVQFLTDRASVAHERLNKPIVLEEYGVETSKGYREANFSLWQTTAGNSINDFDGLMPWQMEDEDNTSYTFSFDGPTGSLVKAMLKSQNAKRR